MTFLTLGHSTRSEAELLLLLSDAELEIVVDVRRFPASRRHPQHNRGALEERLAAHGVRYVWMGDTLGGRRGETIPIAHSPNRAWRVAAFRHYADAMGTGEFRAGLGELERLGKEGRSAVMCAEKLWWRCHRQLIADALLARRWEVWHLLDPGQRTQHNLTSFARVVNGELTYLALL